MTSQPLTIHSWPGAILHVDADAFFASCEQAINPKLRGKPVITGRERGIVTAASYEAKARGIKRGMRLFEAKKVCPDVILIPSDYETYSLFSVRMFDILRRFSPDVEEYSIDEAFIDLTGLRRSFHGPYSRIAGEIQKTIKGELGITVSAGISLTKVLSKIGSNHNKPRGLTVIPGRDIHLYLDKLPLEKVWGIGPNTAAFLRKLGITTALELARKDEGFIRKHLSKPYQEIWSELNGKSVYPVVTESKSSYQSISKTRTFTPPSTEEAFVFAQLSKNLENACIKARRHKLTATRLIIFLRKKDFRDIGIELKLNRSTAYPAELFDPLRQGFRHVYQPGMPYRLTGVVLGGLMPDSRIQFSLFDDTARIEKMSKIYHTVDKLSARFGKHTVQHAASLLGTSRSRPAKLQARHKGERGDIPGRMTDLFKGENSRQRIGLPTLNLKV
ncbi:MAG TPA: DNA polymerase IV [Nitrospirae bacterium]|nr:DNA polymerase IV [Nitrospirota bacterium]HDK16725.1 DNA polymerase IV [Nitrospirota bacterium]HDO25432.1 DNA polymerase IV [Nitrospirota bacterium]HDZ83609.1 DNA polymerase IV [Nitrospirota bacterium]